MGVCGSVGNGLKSRMLVHTRLLRQYGFIFLSRLALRYGKTLTFFPQDRFAEVLTWYKSIKLLTHKAPYGDATSIGTFLLKFDVISFSSSHVFASFHHENKSCDKASHNPGADPHLPSCPPSENRESSPLGSTSIVIFFSLLLVPPPQLG